MIDTFIHYFNQGWFFSVSAIGWIVGLVLPCIIVAAAVIAPIAITVAVLDWSEDQRHSAKKRK